MESSLTSLTHVGPFPSFSASSVTRSSAFHSSLITVQPSYLGSSVPCSPYPPSVTSAVPFPHSVHSLPRGAVSDRRREGGGERRRQGSGSFIVRLFTSPVHFSSPGGLVPRAGKKGECWTFLDWRLNSENDSPVHGQPSSRYTSRYTHRFAGRIMTVRSVVPRVPSLVTGAGKEVGS